VAPVPGLVRQCRHVALSAREVQQLH
jgi:hypothetical protein